ALARGPVHAAAAPRHGLIDELAADGISLLAVYAEPLGRDGALCACVELPAMEHVGTWLTLLALVGRAAHAAGLAALALRGFPPPVDASVAWTTLTPDPAVVEANHAPAHDAATAYAWSCEVYDAAAAAGLAPHRLQYNGVVSDSGGAGHLTLGGPTALDSPFFRVPQLLPRLIRYLSRHPSLSYYFAPVFLGGSGQSPRPDEGGGEAFAELAVALEQLERASEIDASILARSLAPFLVDPAGNPHRSELNIEKLWNPALPGRGCLGLVEFRAFRMAPSPEHATACACLLRAVAAMLSRAAVVPNLWRWGDALHDRFALPFYLQRDLHVVLADLFAAGFGLAEPIRELLLRDPARRIGCATFDGVRVEIDQGLEFWPLVGDVASQETGSSRLVDASTARLQIVLRPLPGAVLGLDDWELGAEGRRVALRGERDADGALRVAGVRYRSFRPTLGLHPCLPARDRVELTLVRPGSARHLRLVMHAWRPDGEAYAGLPADLAEAAERRQERLHATTVDAAAAPLVDPPAAAVSPHCLDLRRL
ncbi:MAG: transglutaminase family protein, partial [Candidatus Binatia bacterium]